MGQLQEYELDTVLYMADWVELEIYPRCQPFHQSNDEIGVHVHDCAKSLARVPTHSTNPRYTAVKPMELFSTLLAPKRLCLTIDPEHRGSRLQEWIVRGTIASKRSYDMGSVRATAVRDGKGLKDI